jgi:hypothetical protein
MMIRIITSGQKPSDSISGEAKSVEPDFWLLDTLPPGSAAGKKVLIKNSKNGACVLPFIGLAKSIQVVEKYQNLSLVYKVIRHAMQNSQVITEILLVDEMQPGNYQIRLEAKKLDWLNPADNPHTVNPVGGIKFTNFMNPILPKMSYAKYDRWIPLKTRHWGQRKLLVCEMQFLAQRGHISNHIVYAGAAPGTHTAVLAQMFPNHTFDLWDPAPFSPILEGHPNVILNQKLFSTEVAASYADKQVLFICDIRRTEMGADVKERDEDVLRDMEDQKEWCLAMKPKVAMLKFRLEWADSDKLQEYFDGEILFQSWAPRRSTETRLITNCTTLKQYSTKEYDDQLNFFNLFARNSVFERSPIPIEGLCHCFDCTSEIRAIKKYLEHYDPTNHTEIQGIMRIEILIMSVFGTQSLQDVVDDVARLKRIREKQYIKGRPAYLRQLEVTHDDEM